MNVLFFGDVHGDAKKAELLVKKSKDADLMVCCGDLSIMGEGFGDIISILDKSGKKMLIIPGNNETPTFVEEALEDYENIISIQEDVYEDNGIRFLGIGGGTVSPWNTPYELTDDEFKKMLSKNYEKVTVLVSHTPPKNTVLDLVGGGMHVGSFEVGKWIEEHQPKYACFGHIHEAAGKEMKIGKTLCFNPGPEGRIIKI
ncbi:3',5'-cyclic adenosine monophosphate phosphodiesterase CpdA [Candidatus Tiddalikarchaeum anstoanum]|nr:3',5'-cyclic adenosine monophosphate phosphodiesterase CpdA [Candidatus Tiddalikarchaeum anstoanum]